MLESLLQKLIDPNFNKNKAFLKESINKIIEGTENPNFKGFLSWLTENPDKVQTLPHNIEFKDQIINSYIEESITTENNLNHYKLKLQSYYIESIAVWNSLSIFNASENYEFDKSKYIPLILAKHNHQSSNIVKDFNQLNNNLSINNPKEVSITYSDIQNNVKPEQIFDQGTYPLDINCIAISGMVGSGKTTLTKYILNAWASQQQPWADRFDWVFYISLSELSNEDIELIKQAQIPSLVAVLYHKLFERYGISITDIEYLLKQYEFNSSRILLILEGYDETPLHLNELALKLCETKQARVLITSRPYGIENIKASRPSLIQGQLECLGFNDNQVKEFITEHYFKNQEIYSKSLLSYLNEGKHKNIWEICHIPINIVNICNLWEQHLKLSQNDIAINFNSATKIYNYLLEMIITNNIQRQQKNTTPNTHITRRLISSLKEPAYNFLRELATIAMDNMIDENAFNKTLDDLLPSKEDQINLFDLVCSNNGIINKIHIGKNIVIYRFIHSSFMEFCTASNIFNQIKIENDTKNSQRKNTKSIKQYITQRNNNLKYLETFIYTTGLLASEDNINYLVNFLIYLNNISKESNNKNAIYMTLKCFKEIETEDDTKLEQFVQNKFILDILSEIIKSLKVKLLEAKQARLINNISYQLFKHFFLLLIDIRYLINKEPTWIKVSNIFDDIIKACLNVWGTNFQEFLLTFNKLYSDKTWLILKPHISYLKNIKNLFTHIPITLFFDCFHSAPDDILFLIKDNVNDVSSIGDSLVEFLSKDHGGYHFEIIDIAKKFAASLSKDSRDPAFDIIFKQILYAKFNNLTHKGHIQSAINLLFDGMSDKVDYISNNCQFSVILLSEHDEFFNIIIDYLLNNIFTDNQLLYLACKNVLQEINIKFPTKLHTLLSSYLINSKEIEQKLAILSVYNEFLTNIPLIIVKSLNCLTSGQPQIIKCLTYALSLKIFVNTNNYNLNNIYPITESRLDTQKEQLMDYVFLNLNNTKITYRRAAWVSLDSIFSYAPDAELRYILQLFEKDKLTHINFASNLLTLFNRLIIKYPHLLFEVQNYLLDIAFYNSKTQELFISFYNTTYNLEAVKTQQKVNLLREFILKMSNDSSIFITESLYNFLIKYKDICLDELLSLIKNQLERKNCYYSWKILQTLATEYSDKVYLIIINFLNSTIKDLDVLLSAIKVIQNMSCIKNDKIWGLCHPRLENLSKNYILPWSTISIHDLKRKNYLSRRDQDMGYIVIGEFIKIFSNLKNYDNNKVLTLLLPILKPLLNYSGHSVVDAIFELLKNTNNLSVDMLASFIPILSKQYNHFDSDASLFINNLPKDKLELLINSLDKNSTHIDANQVIDQFKIFCMIAQKNVQLVLSAIEKSLTNSQISEENMLFLTREISTVCIENAQSEQLLNYFSNQIISNANSKNKKIAVQILSNLDCNNLLKPEIFDQLNSEQLYLLFSNTSFNALLKSISQFADKTKIFQVISHQAIRKNIEVVFTQDKIEFYDSEFQSITTIKSIILDRMKIVSKLTLDTLLFKNIYEKMLNEKLSLQANTNNSPSAVGAIVEPLPAQSTSNRNRMT